MSNHSDLINELKDMEDDSYVSSSGFSADSFLPSSMLKGDKESKKEKKKKQLEEDLNTTDSWFTNIMADNVVMKPSKKRSKPEKSLFDEVFGEKKKKKKKKSKGELVDYKAEFAPEMALYKNLLVDQDAFTKSLQKEYDSIKSTKSSSRGITKQMTDLIDNITSARTLSMQLIEKTVNTKKTIADLNIKQKKELGNGLETENNMPDFGANYLKQIMSERQALLSTSLSDPDVTEYDTDSIINEIGNIDLGDEVVENPYLKFEELDPTVYVCIRGDDFDNYYFEARDKDDNVINDYPSPIHTDINVNRSTSTATDAYGNKYPIIWL